VDDPDQPGFNWYLPFGAKKISDIFSANPNLQLCKEICTPLYRIQLFQRKDSETLTIKPLIQKIPQPTPVPPKVEPSVYWHGAIPPELPKQEITTAKLPILMYHSVAPSGLTLLNRYRITPEVFEDQLKYLSDAGYYSADWDAWLTAMKNRQPLPGRAIMLTFDDGYKDFYDFAWPVLKKYNFTATVFLVTSQIGGKNVWDSTYGEEVQLMSREEIQKLHCEGVVFGSHTATHASLAGSSPVDITKELAISRSSMIQDLGINTKLIAYPYGATNKVVSYLAGGCGYQVGLSSLEEFSNFLNDPLLLPRLEIKGSYSLADFIAKLS
ncbi:MAG: polysaccharide deacetylase family protein, partial [Sphingobacteriales bacterium]